MTAISYTKITRMAVFGFSVAEVIFFTSSRCYNCAKEVVHMMELEDSRQQLNFISEDLQAIRSVALMADAESDWNTEGDVVRLIALATEPVMRDLDEVIAKLDKVIRSNNEETGHDT